MKSKLFILISVFILAIAGCSKDNTLEESVFIADPDDPDLPAYSEWGYNTFGAYYDRIPFISNDDMVPVKAIYTDSVFSFVLNGQYNGGYSSMQVPMSISFIMPDYSPQQFANLVSLNGLSIDLADTVYKVQIVLDTAHFNAEVLHGQLYFKRAQKLFVDTRLIEVILSGYFEFQAIIDNVPITVSDGRFDVGVGSDNFYYY
jgi:hypothetical protein